MNKGCFKCHEPERETVFELDETSRDKAQTLMKSPDFQKVVHSPDEHRCSPDFHKAASGKPDTQAGLVSEKPISHDDLYSLRPMKVATPIRVSNQPQIHTPPPGGTAVGPYTAQLPNGAFDGNPDDAQYDLSSQGMSQLQIDRFLKEPGDQSPEDALTRDVRSKQEDLLRSKQSSEAQPEQQNLPPPQAEAASSSVQALQGDDAAAKDREDRKLKLKAEVAALREQVMKAKAARVQRANSSGSLESSSLEKEFSVTGSTVASTGDDVDGQPVDVVPQGPDLWGSRRQIPVKEEQAEHQDPKRNPQQCLSGRGTDRLCFPARQCA